MSESHLLNPPDVVAIGMAVALTARHDFPKCIEVCVPQLLRVVCGLHYLLPGGHISRFIVGPRDRLIV
jgi:hypothetical protein